jgi:3,4-dihydroxy 2-butanone 4-phosphate synthase/GTP cyclohydrolase II
MIISTHPEARKTPERSKVHSFFRIKTSSIFISSVVLVLAYSEALATNYGSLGYSGHGNGHLQQISQNRLGDSHKHSLAFRGGSFSLSALEKRNGRSETSSDCFDESETELTVSITDDKNGKVNGEKKNKVALNEKGNKKGFASEINGTKSTAQTNALRCDTTQTSDEDQPDLQLPCKYIAETNLPTDIGHFRLRAYRVEDDAQHLIKNIHVGSEPCVIYSTAKPPFGQKEVPVRIHDQCFTSEVFRSQRCDCKEQLKMSLEYVSKHGGAIIYLQQEGRGIGLANKVAAYALQDTGMDTVDANTHLGFPEDCRQYGVVPSMLKDMGIESIKLITNNPRKIERVVALGINVVDTIPMVVQKPNAYNRKYLQTKQDRMNHRNFGEMLQLDLQRSTSEIVNDTVSSLRTDRPIPVAEQYVNAGEEMAALAITSALSEETSGTTDEKGVKAKEDGYCFGKRSVELAIDAISRGEIVVVVDDMDRENEGDFIMAADLATPETMATIVRYSSGVICVGMESDRLDELNLPAMLATNEDPKGTAFTVTVDASKEHGITTGISSSERAKTIKLLATPSATAKDFNRPGHIFPLRAREGGVLTRDGHTEAAVDLSRLAGRHPSGVLCEIVSEENPTEMARLPELKRFCQKHGFVLTSIVDIAQYRRDTGQ